MCRATTKIPSVVAVMYSPKNSTWNMDERENIALSARCGGRDMASSSMRSQPSASTGKLSVMRFIQSSCVERRN